MVKRDRGCRGCRGCRDSSHGSSRGRSRRSPRPRRRRRQNRNHPNQSPVHPRSSSRRIKAWRFRGVPIQQPGGSSLYIPE